MQVVLSTFIVKCSSIAKCMVIILFIVYMFNILDLYTSNIKLSLVFQLVEQLNFVLWVDKESLKLIFKGISIYI